MAVLITGVAGFIGCNLAKILLEQGHTVFGVDNLCCGTMNNLTDISDHPYFVFNKVDMAELPEYSKVFTSFQSTELITEVWHLAANSDIPTGVSDPNVDFRDTFLTTFNTLLLMQSFKVGNLLFASSSAVYGDLGHKTLVENIGPLLPISNYGAMKLASEAIISAAAESYLSRVCVFRFPNVVGVPATHGVILDFVRKLKENPHQLTVLGNGTQQKCYLHVDELIDAMLFICKTAQEKICLYNVGAVDEGATVRFIAEETVRCAAPGANILYGEGNKGWVGDVSRFTYSVEKLRLLGWNPRLSSCEAVSKAVRQIIKQEQEVMI